MENLNQTHLSEQTAVENRVITAESQEILNNMGINIRTLNDCIDEASKIKDPRDLYEGLWYEHELTALYADTNVGKSILAMQIAEHVALMGIRVLYVDLEMSDKGLEKRCRYDDGTPHRFPETLFRATFNFEKMYENENSVDDNGEVTLARIEAACYELKIQALIIDNLTSICAGMETGDVATRLVKQLLNLRDRQNLSVLFLAHTPKLDKTQPITRDSMAGSKRLISLIDSAFAIGEVRGKASQRYVKQTKVRLAETKYHENNVMLCEIERQDGMLRFRQIGTTYENQLLMVRNEKEERDALILELHQKGKSLRQIAETVGISKSQVDKIIKSDLKKNTPQLPDCDDNCPLSGEGSV